MTISIADTNLSEVVHEDLAVNIQAAANLAQEFINSTQAMKARFDELHGKQAGILNPLNGPLYGGDYHFYYRNSEYSTNEGLDFNRYIKDVAERFIITTVSAINREYGVNFEVPVEEFAEDFVTNGINANRIYEALFFYLGGKTFAEVKRQEVIAAFAGVIGRYNPYKTENLTISDYAFVEIERTSLTVNHFYQTDWLGEKASYDTKVKYEKLKNYLSVVLGEFMFNLDNLDVGFPVAPHPNQNSIIKNIRVYKNGKLKITFRDTMGLNQFTAPLMEHFENK